METLSSHYARLLGLDDSWRVESVDLQLENRRVEIRLSHVGSGVICPEGGGACGLADHAEEREVTAFGHDAVHERASRPTPRCRRPEHGVKTIVPPWAGKHFGFILLFVAFAVEVLQACRTVKAAARLLGLSCDAVQTIMDRAVAHGLERRESTLIKHLGIDEKSIGKGKEYITVLTDLDVFRVLDVAPERTQAAAESVFATLTSDRRCVPSPPTCSRPMARRSLDRRRTPNWCTTSSTLQNISERRSIRCEGLKKGPPGAG
jgi:transposase